MATERIHCPRCGESLPGTVEVCDACGLELNAPARPAPAPAREPQRPRGKRPAAKHDAVTGMAWLLLVVGLGVGGMVGYALHAAVAPRSEGGAPQGPADIMAGGTQEAPGGAPTAMPGPVMQMVASYKAALAKNPKDLQALIGLGNLEFDSGQWPNAIEYYSRALDLDGANADVRVDRAIAYHSSGQNDLAKNELVRVTKERPDHKNAWLNLGVVSREMGDKQGAIRAWERYLTLDPHGENAAGIRQEMESLKQAG